MEESFRFEINYTNIRKYENRLYFYKKGSKRLLIFSIKDRTTKRIIFIKPIQNVQIRQGKIFIFHNSSIEIYDSVNLLPENTFVFDDIIDMIYLDHSSYIFVKKSTITYYKDGMKPEITNILYHQMIDEYLILIGSKEIMIYKEFTGLVYSKKIEDFNIEFICIDKFFEDKDKQIYFSIRNQKLYVLSDERIVGHDLNLYLDELYDKRRIKSFDKFTNLNKNVAIYSISSGMLRIMEKNLQNKVLAVKCSEYYIDDDAAFVICGNECIVYEKINPYKRNFELIDENIKYDEREDEFDESDDEYCDFK